MPELETINKLFLELSQFATAKTKREIELEELLRSAHAIAVRKGRDTAWQRFANSIRELGIGSVTARVHMLQEGEEDGDGPAASA